jgi:asparagine synthase (glutamine-hydrolysing)
LVEALGGSLVAPEGWLADEGEGPGDTVQRMTRTDFRTVLPDDFLVKVDRASMAVGLEVRCPFLDHRLVELAFRSIPSALKVRNGRTRVLQKALGRALLPARLELERKQGFSIPLDTWLRQSRCREIQELRPWLPDAIRAQEVDRLISGHLRGRANGARLFNLTMLALACRNGVRGRSESGLEQWSIRDGGGP